ncbi:MAG: alkaline phosphatase family protein [Colwellia sp.]|nr:alkaline phosphatase family protein [Colwellia sp.]
MILISIDGFAHYYLDKFKPQNILAFAKQGTSIELEPVYPSKTFPNHLSIITGAYPSNHGIVHNKFLNPDINEIYTLGAGRNNSEWITSAPIWTIAEQQGIKAAIYFWPESEVKFDGVLPTYNKPYNKATGNKVRFDQMIDWLKLPKEKRPGLIVGYFSLVDTAGHKYKLESKELAQSITEIDTLFGQFLTRLKDEIPLDVNLVLVSDHGMTATGLEHGIEITSVVGKPIFQEKGVTVVNGQTQLYIYFDQNIISKSKQALIINTLKKTQQGKNSFYNVYLKGHYPDHWHFNHDISIIPNIIVEALPPTIFIDENSSPLAGTHGYDAKNNDDLMTIFIAAGVNINKDKKISSFENIHIFPFLSRLLGLKEKTTIDGDFSVLSRVFKSSISKDKVEK